MKISEIKKMQRFELLDLDKMLGMSLGHETYAETAKRLRDDGFDDEADLYEAMEDRWFEVE